MSSMFKKKGGLAFKPKAPVARPRTGPSAPAAKTAPPVPQPAIEESPEPTPETSIESVGNGPVAGDASQGVLSSAGEEPRASEKELPARPSKPIPSQSSQLESSAQPHSQPEASVTADAGPDAANIAETPSIDEPPQFAPRTRTRRQSTAKRAPRPSIETPEQPTPSKEVAAPESTEPTVETIAASEAASEEPATTTRRSTRARAKKAQTTATEASASAAEAEPSRPKKRQRRASRPDGTSEPPAPRKRKTSTPKANASRSSSRRARSATPDDAEHQVVDLQKLRMSDLTRDLRIGKKFSRHDELRERERQARILAKLSGGDTSSEAGVNGVQSPAAPESINGTTAQLKNSTPGDTTASSAAAPSGPQFRIVDGQIVVDQSSLVMDRHARAAAARGNADMETIEENDFTRLITSSSFMNTTKLRGPNIWTESETELFYRALCMFGIDFEMISKMFPGKHRRHVKLKFNREERHNPARITAAITGEKTIKMDIDEYCALTGAQYESLESIEAEHSKIQEGYEAERQKIADEQAEIMRKKKEELFADEDGEDGDFKKKGKGKKKGKQTVRYGLNGEPITGD